MFAINMTKKANVHVSRKANRFMNAHVSRKSICFMAGRRLSFVESCARALFNLHSQFDTSNITKYTNLHELIGTRSTNTINTQVDYATSVSLTTKMPFWFNSRFQGQSLFSPGLALLHKCHAMLLVSSMINNSQDCKLQPNTYAEDEVLEDEQNGWIWMSSTLKKRRAKMNKHKLKKRRKLLRKKTKK